MFTERTLLGKLTLNEHKGLSLFPIGSGSAFTKNLFQNNLLVLKDNNHLLIDCGTRTPEAFFKLGLPIIEIRNFLITHSHADHIGGLEEVILMGRYVSKRKPSIIISKEYQRTLWTNSLKGGAGPNEKHAGRSLGFLDYWNVIRPISLPRHSRDLMHVQLANLDIHTFRTMHYPDSASSWQDSAYSTGVIIDKRILFTGDTRSDLSMIEELCNLFPIELILHDVQFFPGGVHASFDDLCRLPADIRAKTLLMHYPDTYANSEKKVLDAGFAGFLKQQVFLDFD